MPSREPAAEQDTKVCPYCAEVIRAAAIKCRYCQSDLTDVTGSSAAVESAEPVPFVQAEDPAKRIEHDELITGPAGRPRWALPAAVVAGALVLVFLTLAFLDWRAAREITAAEDAARTVRASVPEKVEALLSYDHATFDTDLENAKEDMTSSFADEYEPTVAEIRDRALAQRRSQEADVVAVAVVSKSADEVEMLVFVNTISSRAGSNEQSLMQNRVNVTMVKQDGTWLIDELSVPQA